MESLNQSHGNSLRAIYIATLLAVTVAYRLVASQVEWLGNTSPLMAIAFGGGLLLGRRFWWVPAVILVISDLVLAVMNGWGMGSHLMVTLPFYVIVALAGAACARRQHWGVMWLGTLNASVVFYLLANTFAWATSAAYTHDLAGWWQSQTTGLPGFPPSWYFLRNAIVADTLWCLIAAPLFFSKKLALPEGHELKSQGDSVLFQ